jgi:triosephosphate isomerase
MKRLVIANWKMNLGPAEASLLVKRLEQHIEHHVNTEVVLCPPFVDLFPLAKDVDHKKFKIGAQNAHYLDEGAQTGEVSAAMLKGLATHVILGHSERRAMGETDQMIAQKVAAAIRNNLTPILCVGENLHDHHNNLTIKVVNDQVTAGLQMLTDEDVAKVIIAYEPIWAIGTGTPATPDTVRPAIRAIRTTIEELYGEDASAGMRIIYGASVNGDSVAGLLRVEHIVGFLVGGASLNYAEFSKIVQAVQDFDQ